MTTLPTVTVICICYNHAPFVKRAMDSVLYDQDYPNIQLIVCNDASTDASEAIIREYLTDRNLLFIHNTLNLGNCRTFNKALEHAHGKYIIDLAADDYLMPQSLMARIQHFEAQGDRVGFTYSNARYIDAQGCYLFDFDKIQTNMVFHEGYIFRNLFEGRFICAPTVVFRTSVLKELKGYDEALSFEDFDIWMRISERYSVSYHNSISVAKRIVKGSLSAGFYRKGNPEHLESTLKICEKALHMAQKTDQEPIAKFALYHFRLAYFTSNFAVGKSFYEFARSIHKIDLKHRILKLMLDKKINIYLLYRLYIKYKLKETKLT